MRMKLLIVIPARGGSKRIPRKNVRQMNGKPLIYYSVDTAKKLRAVFDLDIVVSTDDDELQSIVSALGVDTIWRSKELCKDHITLDPVIYDALIQMEGKNQTQYDLVVTMQATSPTLKLETIMNAIKQCIESSSDTLLSVVNRPHLSWKEEGGEIVPAYHKRVNSQELPPNYVESGGFLITKREFVKANSRFGNCVNVYEVSSQEAIDIDTDEDWIIAESLLKRKKILFRVDGEEKLGMGHIYRCLTLAFKMIGHELLFVTRSDCELGINRLKDSFFPYEVFSTKEELLSIMSSYQPDIIVNDILNTDREYMESIRPLCNRIVNFEDLGEGTEIADAVINALYENHQNRSNMYCGNQYFFIRDEFLEQNTKDFSEDVKEILIMFGGSDPSNFTKRLFEICRQLHGDYPSVIFRIITGFGYAYKQELVSDEDNHIFVYNDVKRVSDYMRTADLAITSQGRTIYEFASMGVPAIVLAQNEREMEHTFAQIHNGFMNLGLGSLQEDRTILQTIKWLIETPQIRKEMQNLQLKNELRKGQERVTRLILGEDA